MYNGILLKEKGFFPFKTGFYYRQIQIFLVFFVFLCPYSEGNILFFVAVIQAIVFKIDKFFLLLL